MEMKLNDGSINLASSETLSLKLRQKSEKYRIKSSYADGKTTDRMSQCIQQEIYQTVGAAMQVKPISTS